jgi:hypothetical protein
MCAAGVCIYMYIHTYIRGVNIKSWICCMQIVRTLQDMHTGFKQTYIHTCRLSRPWRKCTRGSSKHIKFSCKIKDTRYVQACVRVYVCTCILAWFEQISRVILPRTSQANEHTSMYVCSHESMQASMVRSKHFQHYLPTLPTLPTYINAYFRRIARVGRQR